MFEMPSHPGHARCKRLPAALRARSSAARRRARNEYRCKDVAPSCGSSSCQRSRNSTTRARNPAYRLMILTVRRGMPKNPRPFEYPVLYPYPLDCPRLASSSIFASSRLDALGRNMVLKGTPAEDRASRLHHWRVRRTHGGEQADEGLYHSTNTSRGRTGGRETRGANARLRSGMSARTRRGARLKKTTRGLLPEVWGAVWE